MKASLRWSIALLAALPLAAFAADPPKNSRVADEAAIRAAIEDYVEAFNRGDAEALAALWSETGEWLSPDGERLQGRKAIETAMKALFETAPGGRLEVADPRVRFLTAEVALEEGTARVLRDGQLEEESTYQAVHVKHKGDWLLESVREVATAAAAPPPDTPLANLAWMVGEWVDASADSTVETRVEWSMNRRFLVSHFKATFADMEPLVGSQVIGYDASTDTIRSWLFDADGTIGEGTWSHDGKQWIVKMNQVLADGRRASATNVYSVHDSDRFAFKSIGRKVDGEFLPNIEEVVVVRKGSVAASTNAQTSEEVAP